MRNMADERRTSRSHSYRNDRNRNRGYKMSCDSNYKCNKSKRKAPLEFSGKPCHVHGNKAKHTYEECRDNPKNCKSSSGKRDDNNNRNAAMMRTITTNATSIAKMSLRTTIVRQSRATLKEQNQAQAAETASATRKITMWIQVKYLEKRGRLVWSKGPHLVRIFEMRSHLIPRSM